jgi:type IV pilus assembly protein PilQ
MRGSINDRFRLAGALLGALVAAGIFACANSTPEAEPATSASSGEIADVVVESGSGASTVTLVGLDEPVFTAFQQSEPDRLIVDLAGVGAGAVQEPVAVYDGIVQEINVAPFGTGSGETMTRVEISLAAPADYDVRPVASGLLIEINALSEMTPLEEDLSAGEMSDDPWAVVPAAESDDADSPEMDAEMDLATDEEPLAPMATPATTLERVDARQVGEGSLIHLVADGSVESATTFTLEDPARLVVDLPEMKSAVAQSKIAIGSPQASRIRIGEHADKIRVVIDGGAAQDPFDGRQVIPVADGLIVALGSGAELDEAVVDASMAAPTREWTPEGDEPEATVAGLEEPAADDVAPVEPSTSDDSLVTIYGVEFDVQDGRDRVAVLAEEPVDFLVYEPDPETVVLSIQGAMIDPEAAVRIAPDAGGPVSLVTAFDQPDVRTPEVRVVVKRAANLKPEVNRRGSLLVMDFPRNGQMATPPPVYGAELGEPPAEGMPMDSSAESSAAAEPDLEVAVAEPGGLEAPASLPPVPEESFEPGNLPPADPAGMDSPAAIEILNEGGLMDGKEYVGRRISLDFKDVEIADVLRLIAEVSDLNVIAGDEVTGSVTIRLVDVPWDQALDVILLTKGLGFIRIGNVLRIAAADLLAQEEEMRLQERRAKEKLEDLVVKLQPVNYADVGDVSGMVKQLLTPRGTVNTDTRTNTLIIKDIPSVIDEATALVKAVDTMTPQVMIEAKIVEASLDFSREFGAVWTFGTNPVTEATLGGRDYTFTGGSDDGWGNQVVFGNPITANPTGLVNLAASVLDDKFNYEVQIQAAETNGDGKVISSPRIVTLDNSEAAIQQGVSIPFQTFENGDAQLEFVDAVLQLKVTPHITSDRSIIMAIEVSRNAPDDSVFTLTGSPAIAKNQVKTETLVKDGQTLVLGGIYVIDKSERQSRVPYLHKIPMLGAAFRSDEFTDSRKELLVFVTPRVVQTPGAAS